MALVDRPLAELNSPGSATGWEAAASKENLRPSPFNKSFWHDGCVFHRHDPGGNVPAGRYATLDIFVTSVAGSPKAQLAMWNPTKRSEFWYSPGLVPLRKGWNKLATSKPNATQTYFTYAVVLSPADTISISDFNVQGQSKLGAGQWVTLRGNRTEAEAHAADAEASSLVDHDDADDWEII